MHKSTILLIAAVTVGAPNICLAAPHRAAAIRPAQTELFKEQPVSIAGGKLFPQGNDPMAFFNYLKTKQAELDKDQYETTAEYDQRSAAVLASSPFSQKKLFAFELPITPRYDADAEAFVLDETTSDYRCSLQNGLRREFCQLRPIAEQTVSHYRGQNAMGVEREIQKRQVTALGVSIPYAGGYTLRAGPDAGDCYFSDKLLMTRDQAKAHRNDSLAVYIVGYISDLKFQDGPATVHTPTVSEPNDTEIVSKGITLTPTDLVYVWDSTGEIAQIRHMNYDATAPQ